jgi:23S rRNA (guanosine2251-2'-O)-methyltransferase
MDEKPKTIVILHNVRSAYNVGSIFRTADAAGVSKIYIVGHTPSPIDRFGRKRTDVAKVALGAEENVPWEHIEKIESLIASLKKKSFEMVSVEQDKKATDFREFKRASKTAFIFGNEVIGLGKNILALSDKILEIPMRGQKESLNVSVSAGIVLFCSKHKS